MSPSDPRVAGALARRNAHLAASVPPGRGAQEPPPDALLDELRRRLLAGETHYTTRPGMVELRRLVAARIEAAGGPRFDPRTELVVTAGRAEAMFAVLLALRAAASVEANGAGESPVRVGVVGDARPYEGLFALLGVEPAGAGPSVDVSADRVVHVLEPNPIAAPQGVREGVDQQASRAGWGDVDRDAITIGDLDDLPHVAPFRIGFATGRAEIIKPVMTWKQAFSICTAAPSQRAAIWALSRAEEEA